MNPAAAPAPIPPLPSWIRLGAGSLTIEVSVRPNAGRSEITGANHRGLLIALKSPPHEGRANGELIKFLAKAVRIPESNVAVMIGARSRRKTVKIASPQPIEIAWRLASSAAERQSEWRTIGESRGLSVDKAKGAD